MQFAENGSRVVAIRRIRITDGPVIDHPPPRAGKKIRIDVVTIRFEPSGGGWQIGRHGDITLEGVVLKADGSEGKRIWSGRLPDRLDNPRWAWLARLAEGLRPRGGVELPFDVLEFTEKEEERWVR